MTAGEMTDADMNAKQSSDLDISPKPSQKSISDVVPQEFTDIIGSSGAWQIWILIITIIGSVPVAWNHMAVPFLAFEYDHWCARPEGYNRTVQDWWTAALPNETKDGISQHSQCEMLDFNNTAASGNFSTLPCGSFEFEENTSTIITEWDLVCEKEWMISMSQSVYMGGFFAAVILSGQLADTYGRHPIIMCNVLILLLSGVAVAYSTSFLMFMIMRFFVAMGQSGLSLTLFVLVIEVAGSEHRGLYSYIQCAGWHIGYCSLPFMGYYVRSWRYLQLAITLPSITFISFYWLLPESPRWLLANGQLDKAVTIMKKAANMNGKEVLDLDVQAKKLCFMAEKENETKNTATVLDLLRTPNLRKKTLNLYFAWIVIAFVYYGLSLNTGDLGGDFYFNFLISGLVEIPATILCILVTKRFGRKIPFMCTLIYCGLACIGFIFIPPSIHWLKITMAMTGKLLVSSAFCIVYIYSAEIFPTVARNVGVGSSSTMARIGSIVAPFMKELGKVTNAKVPMGLFGALSIVSGCLIWFLPETTGYPVPETLKQAEEFGKKTPEQDLELEVKGK